MQRRVIAQHTAFDFQIGIGVKFFLAELEVARKWSDEFSCKAGIPFQVFVRQVGLSEVFKSVEQIGYPDIVAVVDSPADISLFLLFEGAAQVYESAHGAHGKAGDIEVTAPESCRAVHLTGIESAVDELTDFERKIELDGIREDIAAVSAAFLGFVAHEEGCQVEAVGFERTIHFQLRIVAGEPGPESRNMPGETQQLP